MMHGHKKDIQHLPSIESARFGLKNQSNRFKPTNVQPDYYKKRREANFTNMLEAFED